MKMCPKCNKLVNTNRKEINMGIADIWNDHCEDCGCFIDSGFEHTECFTTGDKPKDNKKEMGRGLD